MRRRVFLIVATAILTSALVVSCERLFMAPVPDNSPQSIFDQVWRFADTEYSFFALKEIDWDAVRDTYSPQVRADMTDQELFDLLADMLYELRDGHVNLQSGFDFSRNWQWYLEHPQNFSYELLEREYFDGEQQFVGPFITYDFGDVVYARYGSFASAFRDEHLDYLFGAFAERDGFILDVRDNGGGSSWNAYRIAYRLASAAVQVGVEQYKNGPGHEDFDELQGVWLIPPGDGSATWSKPFVVLTNRSSYSATNLFVALVANLDHVTIVGDTTGGGGGIPTFTELTNGWMLRVSGHRLFVDVPFQASRFNVELGLPPSPGHDVDMDPADEDLGLDTILETALAYIRGL